MIFNDAEVTPVRMEILIDLLRDFSRGLSRENVYRLLQPTPLSGGKSEQAPKVVAATIALGLVKEDQNLSLETAVRKDPDTRNAILTAFDQRVLGETEDEPYFALFFSFLLGLGKGAYEKRDRTKWARDFNEQVFQGERQNNPFNETKFTAITSWLPYAGLGWNDPADNFQANPYDRVNRSLGRMFKGKPRLEFGEFMQRLARTCPELDGGNIFTRANPSYNPDAKLCTLGLSHALVELDLDGILRLERPADHKGWSVQDAEPPVDAHDPLRQGPHISFVELLATN